MKAQPPGHSRKSKEGIWRGGRRHHLSSVTVPPEEAEGCDPGTSPAPVSPSAVITVNFLSFWRDTASRPVLPSLRSDEGKTPVIPCLLREEIIDRDDNIQLHSDDQISPRVSVHRGGG